MKKAKMSKYDAVRHLKTITPDIRINWDWNETIDLKTREALNVLCKTKTYYEVVGNWEDFTIRELINIL